MDRIKFKGLKQSICAFALLIAVSTAYSMDVIVSDVLSGDGEDNFGTTFSQSGAMGTIIEIDLNNFTALAVSSGAFAQSVVNDSVSMLLTAPTGFLISSVKYSESGIGNTTAGFGSASGAINVGGKPNNFPTAIINPGSTLADWSFGNTTLVNDLSSVAVNITNVISAIAFGVGDSSEVTKTMAKLEIGLTAVPIPPAIWMMGAAITALVTVGRRGGQAS